MARLIHAFVVSLAVGYAASADAGVVQTYAFNGRNAVTGDTYFGSFGYNPAAPLTSSSGGVFTFASTSGSDVELIFNRTLQTGSDAYVLTQLTPSSFNLSVVGVTSLIGSLRIDLGTVSSPFLPSTLTPAAGDTLTFQPAGSPSVTGGVVITQAPEPATLAGAGLAALFGLGYGWRRRRPAR